MAFALVVVFAYRESKRFLEAPAMPGTSGSSSAAPATADNFDSMEMSWPTAGGPTMAMAHKARPETLIGRTIAWLGAWHPAVIHFPIALTLTAAFLEIMAATTGKPAYAASNKILLALAVLGGFAAAPLGWADAGLPTVDDGKALTIHRWLGTALPFLLLLVWHLKRPLEQAKTRLSPRTYEMLLGFVVLLILTQAYLGGEITHGANHLAF